MIIANSFPIPSVISGIDLRSIVNINLFGKNPRSADEFYLFDLAVKQSCSASQSIEVVFIKSSLGHRRRHGCGLSLHGKYSATHAAASPLLDLVNIPRHQLDARVLVTLTALVVNSDPSD